jgi:hypothetical protein
MINSYIVVLLVLVVIFIFCICRKKKCQDHVDVSPDDIYRDSSGVFDDMAKLAIHKSLDKEAPTTEDHFRVGHILRNNVLHQEENLFDQMGGVDHFDANHQIDVNQIDVNQIDVNQNIQRRGNVIEEIGNQFRIVVDNLINGIEFELITYYEPFMLDTIQNFIMDDDDWIDLNMLDNIVERRDTNMQTRVADAEEISQGVPGAKLEHYYSSSIQHTDDPQNSHDTSVNQFLRKIVDKLRANKPDSFITIDELKQYYTKNYKTLTTDPQSDSPRHEMLCDVLSILDRAEDGEINRAIGMSDKEAIQYVWARSKMIENSDNKKLMEQSLFDAIYDCWEASVLGKHVVCVNGRTSRIIGSLVCLDYDEMLWDIKTLEHVKNNIFERAKTIIQDTAAETLSDPDENMRTIAKTYLATTLKELDELGDFSEECEIVFKDIVCQKIDEFIDTYINENPGTIPVHMIDTIRNEAKAGV